MSDTSPSQNPRLVVLTALITAVTSIGVSVVGIFPQMQARTVKADTEVTTSSPPPAAEKWSIRGAVVASENGRPVKSADIVLVPMTGQNIRSTGDDGSFEFSGVAAGTYSLVVREPGAGSRVMIPQKRPDDGSDILIGEAPDRADHPKAFVSYKIEKR